MRALLAAAAALYFTPRPGATRRGNGPGLLTPLRPQRRRGPRPAEHPVSGSPTPGRRLRGAHGRREQQGCGARKQAPGVGGVKKVHSYSI